MNFSPFEISVVLGLPILLAILLWSFCRREFPLAGLLVSFTAGAFTTAPTLAPATSTATGTVTLASAGTETLSIVFGEVNGDQSVRVAISREN